MSDVDIEEDGAGEHSAGGRSGGQNTAGSKNRLPVERMYQKMSQPKHVLLLPDTYVSSVEPVTQTIWVYNREDENGGGKNRSVTFVPGLHKIFDEILVNASDNKQRDKNMDCIKIEINPDQNYISIWNNGQGIPVVEHRVEMFVPTLIFGHLLTSSNYNDEEKKGTGGRDGYGARLCNIFNAKFIVETYSRAEKKLFKQQHRPPQQQQQEPKQRGPPAKSQGKVADENVKAKGDDEDFKASGNVRAKKAPAVSRATKKAPKKVTLDSDADPLPPKKAAKKTHVPLPSSDDEDDAFAVPVPPPCSTDGRPRAALKYHFGSDSEDVF